MNTATAIRETLKQMQDAEQRGWHSTHAVYTMMLRECIKQATKERERYNDGVRRIIALNVDTARKRSKLQVSW